MAETRSGCLLSKESEYQAFILWSRKPDWYGEHEFTQKHAKAEADLLVMVVCGC